MKKNFYVSLAVMAMKIKIALIFHLTPIRMIKIQKQYTANVGVSVKKQEPLFTVHGIRATLENSVENSQSAKKKSPIRPVIAFCGICSKVLTSYSIDACSVSSTVAVLRIGRKLKQSNYPSASEWITKMWYIYTIESYLTVKKNGP